MYSNIKFKLAPLLTLLGLMGNVYSQSYTFSNSTGTYADLVSPISLNNGITWDDPQYAIPIGFNFQLFSTSIDTIYIEDVGLGAFLMIDTNETGVTPLLVAYGADIIDRGSDTTNAQGQTGSLSPISYKLEGSSGSHILKIEWKNVGFYSELADDNNSSDFTNFQLWFYEGSNDIEMHFGLNSILQPNLSFDQLPGAAIGLFPSYDVANDTMLSTGMSLEGNPASPNLVSDTTLRFLNGAIPNGTIYTFKNASIGTAEHNPQKDYISTYPNPSYDHIYINHNQSDLVIQAIVIYNSNGQKVKNAYPNDQVIDISGLSLGTYYIHISTNQGVVTKRILKI